MEINFVLTALLLNYGGNSSNGSFSLLLNLESVYSGLATPKTMPRQSYTYGVNKKTRVAPGFFLYSTVCSKCATKSLMTPLDTIVSICFIAWYTLSDFEEPCDFTTAPLRPKSTAPPN